MDSKLLKISLVVMVLFMVTVFGVILLVNGQGTTKKQQPVVKEQTGQENEVYTKDGQIVGSDLQAWMYDDTFFDEEKIQTLERLEQDGKVLSMMVTSIEKDLRIRILDGTGKIVKGQPFKINLGEEEEYKDLDRDGVIYIGDMKPGQYEVLLQPVDGYIVPSAPTKVKVKEHIEYAAIDDISYLIKTEDEINAVMEDTAKRDAGEETSGTSAIKTSDEAKFGIDVSKWNKEIDWKQVKEAGVEFAIIRVGYRGSVTGSLVLDPYFEKNIQGATQNGIDVGVYFFTQALDESEAIEEASMVLKMTQGYRLDYPVFIDTEGAGGNGRADKLDVQTRSKVCQAFCETIRSAGKRAGIYASKNWFLNALDITKFTADNVIWLAEYNDEATYGGTYQMWQYTSSGRIGGIEGRVDFNLSYLDNSVLENPDEELEDSKPEDPQNEDRQETDKGEENGQNNSRDM